MMHATLLLIGVTLGFSGAQPSDEVRYSTVYMSGWAIKVNQVLEEKSKEDTEKALKLLKPQLDEIVKVVPKAAVQKLRKVTLWFSTEYEGIRARAEYHPGAQWLRENKRDPAMVKGVEFTNIRIFEAETKRMPNFALHELAHAYHDQALGNGHAGIKAAYEKAKVSGKYGEVEQRFGDGRTAKVRAYAMTNPQEYFAECSEAYFSTNDFFPFTRSELEKYDPEMFRLLHELWGVSN